MSSAVVGIDLGYTNSVIAAAGRGGVDVILNGNSNRQNPTMIGFSECRKLGEQAAVGAVSNYRNTAFGMKRLVGLAFDDPRAQKEMKHLPNNFVPIPHANGTNSIGVQVDFAGETKVVPVEALLGKMIHHLGEIAAQKAAQASDVTSHESLHPHDWVIGIPSYYTDAQRRALLVGCEMVGIGGCVQRLMHDSTATALAYGIFKDLKKEFTKDAPTNVMFIDMGASAYTVSIVSFEPGKLIVKAVFCDQDLGGRDFDWVIAEWIAQEFEHKFGAKLSSKPMETTKTRIKLLAAAEKAKKTLSPQGVKEAHINIEMVQDDLDFHGNLSAETYEKIVEPLLARLAAPVQAALAEAKLTAQDLSSVEVVGGSTRIGCVKRALQAVLNCNLSTTLNADECVARGAALQSAILSPRFKVLPYDIHEAQPYPIKITWEENGQGMEVDAQGENTPTDSVIMFDRGLNFPIVRRVTLRRAGTFVVNALYDDSAVQYGFAANTPRNIASISIHAPEGEEKKVRVNIKEDIHGIIVMSSAQMVEEIDEDGGTETGSDDKKDDGDKKEEGEKKKKIKKTNLEYTITHPMEWTKEEISKIYEEEVAMSNTDRVVKETADMRNELESYIYDMRDKVDIDSQLGMYGTQSEKDAFKQANEAMENWLYEEGFDATKSVYADKLAELKKLGYPMERRQGEAQARPASINNLQATLELYKNWLNESQGNEKYAHIGDEERQKVHNLCDEVSAWMYDMLDKQGALAASADPVLTSSDLNAKSRQLKETCGPIMHKPAPKKKEEPKKEEAPKEQDEDKKDAGSEPEPMDVEGAKKSTAEGSDEPARMDVD